MPLLLATANPGVASWSADGDSLVIGSGGNARGAGAIDLQTSRGADAQVAGGPYTAIVGGQNNTIDPTAYRSGIFSGYYNYLGTFGYTVDYSAMLGGRYNRLGVGFATGSSVIVGGNHLYLSGYDSAMVGGAASVGYDVDYSAIIAGSAHAISYAYSVSCSAMVGGFWNRMGQTGNAGDAVMIGGTFNSIDADNAVTLGGRNIDLTGEMAVAMGNNVTAHHPGSFNLSASGSATGEGQGDSQAEIIHMAARTTNGSTVTMKLRSTEGIAVRTNTVISAHGTITAWNESDGSSTTWTVAFQGRNAAGTTTLDGSSGFGNVAAGTFTAGGMNAGVTTAIAADDPNDTIDINVTGDATPTTIRWSAAFLLSVAGT